MWNQRQNMNSGHVHSKYGLDGTTENVSKRNSSYETYSGKNSRRNGKIVIEPMTYQERQLNGFYSGGKKIAASQPDLNTANRSGYYKGTHSYGSSMNSDHSNEIENIVKKKKGFFQEIRKKFNSQRGSPLKENKTTGKTVFNSRAPVQSYYWDQNQQQTNKLKSLEKETPMSTFSKINTNKQNSNVVYMGTYAQRRNLEPSSENQYSTVSNLSYNGRREPPKRAIRESPSFRHIGVQTEDDDLKTRLPNTGGDDQNHARYSRKNMVSEISSNFIKNDSQTVSQHKSFGNGYANNAPKPGNMVMNQNKAIINGQSLEERTITRNNHLKRNSWQPSQQSNYNSEVPGKVDRMSKSREAFDIIGNLEENRKSNSPRGHSGTKNALSENREYERVLTEKRYGGNASVDKSATREPSNDTVSKSENHRVTVKPRNEQKPSNKTFKEELESTLRRKKATNNISRDYEVPQSYGMRRQIPSYQKYQDVPGVDDNAGWVDLKSVTYNDYSSVTNEYDQDKGNTSTKRITKHEMNENTKTSTSKSNHYSVPQLVPPPPPPPMANGLFSQSTMIKSSKATSSVSSPLHVNSDQRSMLMEQIRNARSDKSFYVVGDDSDEEESPSPKTVTTKISKSRNSSSYQPAVKDETPVPDYD